MPDSTKHAHRVNVDGRRFRWSIRCTWRQVNPTRQMVLTIEDGERSGAKLLAFDRCIQSSQRSPSNLIHTQDVAGIVRHALSNGWVPDLAGPDFRIQRFTRLIERN